MPYVSSSPRSATSAIGTLFTLFIVPSIYMLVARTRVTAAEADAGENEIDVPSSRLRPSLV